MIVAAVIEPSSKLAWARGLRSETATSSLGEVLSLAGCDEDDLYEAMDWLAARQDAIEERTGRSAPAGRHPRALRRLLGRLRGSHLSPRRARSREGRRARSPADRLRTARHQGGRARRHRGLQGQHRRPQHRQLAGEKAQGAVRAHATSVWWGTAGCSPRPV